MVIGTAGVGLPLRTRVASGAGGAVAALSRGLGRGGGSVIGGRAILALDPEALQHLARDRSIALVTGTNGKTTTTSLLKAALATKAPVVTNVLGANLPAGLAAALAASPAASVAALEVDEAWLGRVVEATSPKVAVLLNLSRDQLDRNNEVRRLSSAWRSVFAGRPGTAVVANADDPLVAWAAVTAHRVTWVGAGQPWTADAAGCPSCGGRILFADNAHNAHNAVSAGSADNAHNAISAGSADNAHNAGDAGDAVGGWACSTCDFRRPPLDMWLEPDAVVTATGGRYPLQLALPGRANRANAAMAAATAECFGIMPITALAAMAATDQVAGRYRTVTVGTTRARLLLAKNPAGWLEMFDLLAPPPTPVVVAINARIADGRDPSWLWDVPFERLKGRLVVATGERSRDLAVRLLYAEVEHRHQPDLIDAIHLAHAPAVDVVANYTSFQQLSARVGRGR